jgi:hypothetical protein
LLRDTAIRRNCPQAELEAVDSDDGECCIVLMIFMLT